MTIQNSLEINIDRLWNDIYETAKIGKGKTNGLSRLTLSQSDKDVRSEFISLCLKENLKIRVDEFGNIFAKREGQDNSKKTVLVGSHLDTHVAGGKFDGVLGVLSGLEIIRTLNQRNIQTLRPIEIVSWTNEEGARYPPPMMGSGAFVGIHDKEWVYNQTDSEKLKFIDELKKIGFQGSDNISKDEFDSYFELHIEQGSVLEDEGKFVGIVTKGYSAEGRRVSFTGETSHSGTTPMNKRKNALVGAAMFINFVENIANDYENLRAAITKVDVWPNTFGIVPDFAEVVIDVRHENSDISLEVINKIDQYLKVIEKEKKLITKIEQKWAFNCDKFSKRLIQLVSNKCEELKVGYTHMFSQAAHDAYHLTNICDSVLIFCPCKDGLSHNENEHVDSEVAKPSINVLLNSIVDRANQI
jgi:N-carbamoyl-L-amino-acid hydrolase